MNTINPIQWNAVLQAMTQGAPPTISALGFLGGGVSNTTDFNPGFLHSNAVLDTRGFTATNQGSVAASLDANGIPNAACSLVLTTALTTAGGPLAAGNYFLNVPSAGQSATASISGISAAGAMTLGTGVPQGDGVTIRYPLTIAAGVAGSAVLNFSGALSAMPDVARDGSTSSVGQPLIAAVALTHYSQFPSLRLMDLLNTNSRTDTTWSTRPPNWALPAYAGAGYSWEFAVAFINGVAAAAGSKLKAVFVNIPPYADNTYVATLAAYLTTLGLTSSVQLYVDRSNEHWNPNFTSYTQYNLSAYAELNYLANYGTTPFGISSITSDGTNFTFTTTSPIGSYLTTTANCVVIGGVGGFNIGSIAAPVVATKTGASTFTVPSTSTYTGGAQFGVIFNLSSSLVTDGVLPDANHAGNKWYVRLLYQDWQTWSAIRPQDRFFMDTALYGGEGVGGSATALIEYAYAAYINGGSATWLYGAATGYYVTATSASTTLNLLFAQLNTLVTTTMDGYVRAHVYQCKMLGIHPMAYEGGPDLQQVPSLMISAMTDARMGAVTTALLNTWFSNGGETFNWYYISPAAFTANAQGGWSALQSYADTTSPKVAAILAYLPNAITYSNIFGSPGTVDIAGHYQFSTHGAVTNGLLGYYSGAPYYTDVVIAVPATGNYTLTLVGCSHSANTCALYLDPILSSNGTSIGTSTLTATAGGWGVDSSGQAVSVVDPVTVSLTVGIHTIRIMPTTGGTGGAALLSMLT